MYENAGDPDGVVPQTIALEAPVEALEAPVQESQQVGALRHPSSDTFV